MTFANFFLIFETHPYMYIFYSRKILLKNLERQDFHGGSVVKTLPSTAGDVSSIPGLGAWIPCALWPKKYKTNNIVRNSIKI